MTDIIYTLPQIKTLLTPVFAHHKVKRAVLFGSYAKGCARQNSDIDILVDSGLKGLAFFGLLEDVVTTLDKDVDMLDVTEIIPDSEVDNEITESGVTIYDKL